VTYLAIRGQVEFQTLAALTAGADVKALAGDQLKVVLAEWEQAEATPGSVVSVPDDGAPGSPTHAQAVERGHALFTAKGENACITCHAEYGRKPVLRYDVWGTVATPADLTQPARKVEKPEELFQRIRGGIAAVGMPAHPQLTDRQVWDLVRFVQSAPHPRELPPDPRAVVHPNP
jgi:mono/diheme cytochrome c family protein